MAGVPGNKPAPARKAKARFPDRVLHAYQFVNAARVLRAGLKLPEHTRVLVVPDTAAADAELRKNRTLAPAPLAPSVQKDLGSVATKAYEPDARGRAILRGIAYAHQDIQTAGGAYAVEDVRSLLGNVSRQAVDKRVTEGSLLAVPGPSGRRRFPTAQFNDDGSVVGGLKDVQAALGFTSRWAVLNFLVNPHDLLSHERPLDVLRRGEVARVVQAAERSGTQGG